MTEQVQEQVQVAEPSPTELEARQGGWVPKDEYQGDENKWVDADEFVRRGPLFEKINSQNREVKELRKALDQLKVHHINVKETSYKEALATLRAEKKAAFVDGDPDKIVEIDEEIDKVKTEQRNFEAQQAAEATRAAAQYVNPEFQAWSDRNTWYNTSKPMRAFADAIGIELHQSGMTPSEVLKRVEAQVKEEFPNKFRNPNRDKVSAVEGGNKGSGKSAGAGYQLSATEREIMERFVRQKIMTADEYIAELKKTKESN